MYNNSEKNISRFILFGPYSDIDRIRIRSTREKRKRICLSSPTSSPKQERQIWSSFLTMKFISICPFLRLFLKRQTGLSFSLELLKNSFLSFPSQQNKFVCFFNPKKMGCSRPLPISFFTEGQLRLSFPAIFSPQ